DHAFERAGVGVHPIDFGFHGTDVPFEFGHATILVCERGWARIAGGALAPAGQPLAGGPRGSGPRGPVYAKAHGIEGGRPALAYARASRIMLKGVSVARRTLAKPALPITSRRRCSPAWAPSAAPTSCDFEVGTQTRVEAA